MYNNPLPVSPLVKLSGYNDKEWEIFIEECIDELKVTYAYKRVIAFGGAGDKGRDICAYTQEESVESSWDLYQAKHYGSVSTNPSNFFPELAKFFDMLISNEYTIPNRYFLCTLKMGSKLKDCFLNREKFKLQFIDYVLIKNGIFTSYTIQNDINIFINYIKNFDFKILKFLTPKELLEIHTTSKYHYRRFGELPLRENDPLVPSNIIEYEDIYITELLKLYNDFSGENFTIETLEKKFKKHLYHQRKVFFIAEGLHRFSRDKLPNEFENLLNEIFDALGVLLYGFHNNNMEKFDKIITYANSLKVANNPLYHRMKPGDISGCCHHLVNNKEFEWVDND